MMPTELRRGGADAPGFPASSGPGPALANARAGGWIQSPQGTARPGSTCVAGGGTFPASRLASSARDDPGRVPLKVAS